MLDVGGLGLIEARVDGVEGWHEVRKILVYGTVCGPWPRDGGSIQELPLQMRP